MEEGISLKEIAATLKKRLLLIIVITSIAVAVSGLISYYLLTPVYQASTQILVNQIKNNQKAFDVDQVRTNVEMINTYSVIIKSPTILDKVAAQMELKQEADDLTNRITVNSEQNSQVFTVTVEDEDPAQAVKIANTIGSTFQSEIKKIMNVDNVSILSKAVLKDEPTPVNPKPFLNMIIAFVIGLMVAVGIAFLLDYLDNTIKTEDDIQNHLQLPLLGVIPMISTEDEKVSLKNRTDKNRMGSETIES
jgi:capsular polysaccharide biosynthesis protein